MRFFSSLVRPDESTGAVMRWVHRIWVFFWLTVLGAGIGLLSLYLTAHSYASIDATALLQSYFKIPLLVMMNLLAPILLVYLGFFLFARPWAAYLLSALPFFTLALASYYKVQLRGDPVLATDLRLIRTAGGIMGNYTFEISAPVIVVLEGFVLMLVLSCLMLRKERMSPRSRLAGIMLMLSVTLACYFELRQQRPHFPVVGGRGLHLSRHDVSVPPQRAGHVPRAAGGLPRERGQADP